MSDSRKYYYLKLKDNYFDTDEMIVLESMPDGYLYSNILLKLYLRSLKSNGRLMFNDRIPFNSTMLAQVTRHSEGVIEKAMRIFRDMGLIEVLDSGAIFMADIENYIGSSSTEADRKRLYRSRIEKEKKLLQDGSHDGSKVVELGHLSGQASDISPPEIEIEIEREIEKEKKIMPPYEQIINLLNQYTGKSFKHTARATQSLINGRYAEGFTIDEFEEVIKKKSAQWKDDEKMSAYLRPATLFGTKFESYLNENMAAKKNQIRKVYR